MERLAPVLTESEFDFEFREPANLPNPMLSLQGVKAGYGKTVIVHDVPATAPSAHDAQTSEPVCSKVLFAGTVSVTTTPAASWSPEFAHDTV